MALIQRFPWRAQPQPNTGLDKSNRLGALLDYVWVGNSLSGFSTNGLRAAPHSSAALRATPQGMAITNTSGTNTSAATVPALNRFPYIQVAYGYLNTSTNNQICYFSGAGSNSGFNLSSATIVTAQVRYNFGTQRNVQVTLPDTRNTPLCLIFQVLSDTDQRLYVNGLQTNATASPGTINSALTSMTAPGSSIDGGSWLIGYGQGHGVLADNEVLEITSNPSLLWQMFAPLPRKIWAPAAAGGGGGFQPAWARGSNTILIGGRA